MTSLMTHLLQANASPHLFEAIYYHAFSSYSLPLLNIFFRNKTWGFILRSKVMKKNVTKL